MSGILEINSKLHYGLILMTELAKAHKKAEALSLEKIAQNSGFISAGYLEEIAASLRSKKLIAAKRGAKGGYQLTRDPKKISAADIIAAIKGHSNTLSCQNQNAFPCPVLQKCHSKKLWIKLQTNIEKILKQTSLADLI